MVVECKPGEAGRAARAKPARSHDSGLPGWPSTEPAFDPSSGSEQEAHRSLWPVGIWLALLAMIAGSLCLLWIASTHPDGAVTAHPLASAGAPAPRPAR